MIEISVGNVTFLANYRECHTPIQIYLSIMSDWAFLLLLIIVSHHNIMFCGTNFYIIYVQILKDWHLITATLILTGISVILLTLEAAVPQLRGSVTLEEDGERAFGRTV